MTNAMIRYDTDAKTAGLESSNFAMFVYLNKRKNLK
jgi:hypothetical protein